MKIKSSYRRPIQRLSRRSTEQSFFGGESESEQKPFFNSRAESRSKEESGNAFQGKEVEEEEATQAKEEEEESLQAKEEEESMQAKEEEEESLQAKEEEEESAPAAKEKCACGADGKEDCGKQEEEPETSKIQAKGTSEEPSTTYQKCHSKTHEPFIKQAVNSAKSLADRASGASTAVALIGGVEFPDSTPTAAIIHHQRWFGKFHQRRASSIARTYRKVAKALTGKLYFNCRCKKNIYAYVIPGGRRKIYLCKKFWSAGSSGFDSKPGVIVHELAHEVNLSIGDKGYGTAKAENLAKSKPRKAAHNADNYEYYAESL